jgi:hypothetical protein
MSDTKNTAAGPGPAMQAVIDNFDAQPVDSVTIAARVQVTRDSINALLADGNLTPDVHAVALRIVDDVAALFSSVESSTTAPSVLDYVFVDGSVAKLVQVLQGVRDIANGNRESVAAHNYRVLRTEDLVSRMLRRNARASVNVDGDFEDIQPEDVAPESGERRDN